MIDEAGWAVDWRLVIQGSSAVIQQAAPSRDWFVCNGIVESGIKTQSD